MPRPSVRTPAAGPVITVAGIDPGPEESALVLFDGQRVVNAVYQANEFVLAELIRLAGACLLVIEKIASFGMPVGAEVFETVYWSGRFAQAYGVEHVERITRIDVKMHLCHSPRAKDANIRQALIDRFGKVGTKKNPGPLYGISGDLLSALAVAVTQHDRMSVSGLNRKVANY
jgi:hypothetical protein